jgi:hypothetical protein
MRYFDADKEWEIAVLFLVEKNLISEYREFHKNFVIEERDLTLKKIEEHYSKRVAEVNKFTDSLPKKEEEGE